MLTIAKLVALILVAWYLIGYIFYLNNVMFLGFPLTRKSFAYLIFCVIIPQVWLGTTAIIGLVYYGLINHDPHVLAFFVVLPIALIVTIILGVHLRGRRFQREDDARRAKEEEKRVECLEWLKAIDSYRQDQVSVQTFTSRNKLVGNMTVRDLSNEQAEKLRYLKYTAPKGIHLNIVTKEAIENLYKNARKGS